MLTLIKSICVKRTVVNCTSKQRNPIVTSSASCINHPSLVKSFTPDINLHSNFCHNYQNSRTGVPFHHFMISVSSPSLCRLSWFCRLTADLGYTTWTRPWTSDSCWPFCSGSMKNSPLSVRINPAWKNRMINIINKYNADGIFFRLFPQLQIASANTISVKAVHEYAVFLA